MRAGELVRFETGFDGIPANIDADVLVAAVGRVAAVALLARHWPAEGARHRAFLALAGVLARAQWPLEEALRPPPGALPGSLASESRSWRGRFGSAVHV